MKITKLTLYPVPPRWMFLKIETDEGVSGWGEPVVEGKADTVAACVREMEPYLLGRDPRRIEDLTVLHLVEKERPFEVVKIVKLAKIDYENFITDMVADRQFIEDHAALCSKGEVWRCILVQQRGHTDGVLVMPEDSCFVGWAAYYSE